MGHEKKEDVLHKYCSKWRLPTNVSKSAVMVFSKDAVNGCWKWGEHSLPKSIYLQLFIYIAIDFSSNGTWDMNKESTR